MSIHDIPTTYHSPDTAYAIEGIKSKWISHFFTPNTRIQNMTAGDPGVLDRAPHVNAILKSLYVFGIKINIPAPFARILELAGGGNQTATTMIFLDTISRRRNALDLDQEYTVSPFDWSEAWSLGPPVYGEDMPYSRSLNRTIDEEVMHELAKYPGKFISFLDYSWYWKAKIQNKPYSYAWDMMLQSIADIGPHKVKTYRKLGPGNYEASDEILLATVPGLKGCV